MKTKNPLRLALEELAVYICQHVFDRTHPVLLVSHEENEDWQFLCGGRHEVGERPRVVGLNHILEEHPLVRELLDLPLGWEAERESPDGEWVRRPSPPEDDEPPSPPA